MAEAKNVLKPVLEQIAKEQEYIDCTTELSLIPSCGANYTSQLFNIKLSAPGKDDIKLFAKVAALGEKMRSISTMQVFEIEKMFYATILPKYREYEEKYKFPKEDRLLPAKFYGASTEYMKEVLVLEELTAKGYQPFDRFECYDWEYASKCLSYLAKLHALSVRYERDHPEEFGDMIQKLAFKLPIEEMKDFMEERIAGAIGVTADEYKERLTKFITENMTDEPFKKYYDPPRKVALNHGDFRPSNVMHKTGDNGQLEVLVVDYQALQKGNPVADLMYFFISGSDEEFREKHFDQFFEHYYSEFSKTLRMLEINPEEVYTKDQFDEDVKELLPMGIILGVVTLPFITVEEQNAPKVEDGIDVESFAMELSNLFQKRFNALVRDYVKMNIL